MGKRELLIALAFIVAGTVAFQFSAPPAKSEESGFSFSRLLSQARREMRGSQSYAAPPRQLVYAVDGDITELRLAGMSGPLKVVGEARADVVLELTVMSTGESEAAAVATANKTTVKEDRFGHVLTLEVKFPEEETQSSQAVLKVPTRLAIRLNSNRETTVSNVRAVDFAGPMRGTTDVSHIAEHVAGTQSGGAITLASIGSLKMTLTRTRARISSLTGEASLDISDGDTEISGAAGSLTIDERRGDVTIRQSSGPLKISGSDGQVRLVEAGGDVQIDVRRAEVEAELLSRASGTLTTTDEELRVSFREPVSVRLDAMATNGKIDGQDWNVSPVVTANDARLDTALGAKSSAAPRVSLRNQGANIVLKKSSKK